ncbi:MFS transporter [Pseudonocardiaceae bacterium YIM PH 21723]|nr:MFS transporter [Pseudonocardiaceae bacterium YIM PH 21723]
MIMALAISQTVGFGVLYYMFAVFLPAIAAEFGVDPSQVTGAFAAGVLATAVAAVPVGRWVDRRGGRGMLVGGAVLGVVAVAGWSQVRNLAELYLAMVAIGIAGAMVLYEVAFAVLVQVVEPRRRQSAILAVTVVAGFASTIFIPLAGLLNEFYGWRIAVLLLAVLFGAVVIPLHVLAVPQVRRSAAVRRAAADRRLLPTVLRDPGFWLLGLAFTVHGGAVAIAAVHTVSYLIALGHPATLSAAVAGLFGAMSVAGRLLVTRLSALLPIATLTAVIMALQAVAIVVLVFTGRSIWAAAVCVLVFGLGFGVATIARPVLLAERYPTAVFATVSGVLAAPMILAKAFAPLGAALLLATFGGYLPMMLVVILACLMAAGALWLFQFRDGRQRRSGSEAPRSNVSAEPTLTRL